MPAPWPMATTPAPIPRPRPRRAGRVALWLDRWGGILPLLIAEFVVWLGFGGLLPVLPLYFTEQGIDLATLGPRHRGLAGGAARERADLRLAGRPHRAGPTDGHRAARDRPLRALPLVLTGPLAFIVLRAGAGLGAAIYDPAARGYLTDATPPERRGEAFGLYGAAQMGGLLLGPTIGGHRGRDLRRASASCSSSARSRPSSPRSAIALRVRETRRAADARRRAAPDSTEFPLGRRRHRRPRPRPTSTPIATRTAGADGADAPAQPRPDRGDRSSTPAATSRAARTRSSGACSCRASGPISR